MSKLLNTLRNKLMNPYYKYMAFLSYVGKPYICNNDTSPKLLFVTVAYNTPILIQYQIEYIKKYLQDEDYQLIVADNSTKDKYRKEIQKICEDNGIEYIPIPMYTNRLHTSRGLSWSITWSSPQLVVLSCANCPQTKVFLVLSTTTSSLLLQHPFCNISRKA